MSVCAYVEEERENERTQPPLARWEKAIAIGWRARGSPANCKSSRLWRRHATGWIGCTLWKRAARRDERERESRSGEGSDHFQIGSRSDRASSAGEKIAREAAGRDARRSVLVSAQPALANSQRPSSSEPGGWRFASPVSFLVYF